MKNRTIKDPTYSIYKDGGNVENKAKATGKKELKKLAKDIKDIEFDITEDLYDQMRSNYREAVEKGYKGNFMSWVQSQSDDYFKRIELKDGSKVIKFSDYVRKNPKVKKINLADHFKLNQTVADLSDADIELVNRLLKMSLGKED
jgi:hypothetical protein|tara:strand:- start:82 stop:516 length:435 start_codon:yes stop_codon:yes gene_type:complete